MNQSWEIHSHTAEAPESESWGGMAHIYFEIQVRPPSVWIAVRFNGRIQSYAAGPFLPHLV